MAHDLYYDRDKYSLMYVGSEPWHGLGQRLEGPATAALAIEAANLDWEVVKRPLYAIGDRCSVPVKDMFGTMRADRTGDEAVVYGIVGRNYRPLQNREAFEFFDPIVGQGAAVYHTAGALGHGERVWILAKLPGEIRVADGDISDKYLLLSNSHDGESSVQIKFTPIRVVCNNTLTMALSQGPAIRVAHTRDMKQRLQHARDNLKLINANYQKLEQMFKVMVTVSMQGERLTEYLTMVFPDPNDRNKEAAVKRAIRNRRAAEHFYRHGKGNDQPAVAGTLWAAYNGVTEFIDHIHGRRTDDQHLESIWFGKGYLVKARAFEIARERAASWR
jgi:phage/plasmid-like protein (TIGR03299 family)